MIVPFSWANKRYENHETNDLPKALSWLGKGKEFYNNIVPEKLSNKGKDEECKEKGKKCRNTIGIDFALHVWGSIGKSFNGSSASRLNRGHF
jgi:hypothetical protein